MLLEPRTARCALAARHHRLAVVQAPAAAVELTDPNGRYAYLPLDAARLARDGDRTRGPATSPAANRPANAPGALPQAVLLLQPLLRCWDGHCRTCHRPIDLNQLTLFSRRE